MGDIRQKIVWYDQDDFEMPNPVCDFCGNLLEHFPRCVKGSYALCIECQEKCGIKEGDNEYFETFAYNIGMEPKKLGINCGGREA